MIIMKKGMFIVVVVLLLIAFGVSAFMVGSYLLEGKEQEDRYNELSQIAANSTRETTAAVETTQSAETTQAQETTQSTEPTDPTMITGYAAIYEQNPDTVGWLKIEGTKLDYPVMQTPNDRDYYLYRDFDKKDSRRGSLYAWADASITEPSDNITIFGHNMADGSMFACLNNYTDKAYWEENSLIFFDTLNEYHTYKIYAVFKTSANIGEGYSYHQFVNAATEDEFNTYVKTVKDLAFYDTGITPVYGDKLIALSTCEYTLDNGRLVVCAVRIT